MNAAARRYVVEFGGAMALYAATLIGSRLALGANPDAWWRFLVAVLPVVPAIFGMLAFMRFFGRMDEQQRRVHLEAMAFAIGATIVLTFAYGFLEGVGLPRLDWTWIAPLMIALWGIGAALASRRYA